MGFIHDPILFFIYGNISQYIVVSSITFFHMHWGYWDMMCLPLGFLLYYLYTCLVEDKETTTTPDILAAIVYQYLSLNYIYTLQERHDIEGMINISMLLILTSFVIATR